MVERKAGHGRPVIGAPRIEGDVFFTDEGRLLEIYRGKTPPTTEDLIAPWDENCEKYHTLFRDKHDTTYNLVELPEVRKAVNGRVDGAVVFDPGGAGGRFLKDVFEMGVPKRVIELDPSKNMINCAEAYAKEIGVKTKVDFWNMTLSMSISEMKKRDISPDLVLALNVLHLLPYLKEDVQGLHDVMPVGGRLVALVKGEKRLKYYARKSRIKNEMGYDRWGNEIWPGGGAWVRRLKDTEWYEIFKKSGFNTTLYSLHPSSVVGDNYPKILEDHNKKGSGVMIVADKV